MASKKVVEQVMFLLESVGMDGEKPVATLQRLIKNQQVSQAPQMTYEEKVEARLRQPMDFCESHARGFRGKCPECESQANEVGTD